MNEPDAVDLMFLQPCMLPHGFTNPFLLVYLKLNSLVYFVESAMHLVETDHVRMALFAFYVLCPK